MATNVRNSPRLIRAPGIRGLVGDSRDWSHQYSNHSRLKGTRPEPSDRVEFQLRQSFQAPPQRRQSHRFHYPVVPALSPVASLFIEQRLASPSYPQVAFRGPPWAGRRLYTTRQSATCPVRAQWRAFSAPAGAGFGGPRTGARHRAVAGEDSAVCGATLAAPEGPPLGRSPTTGATCGRCAPTGPLCPGR